MVSGDGSRDDAALIPLNLVVNASSVIYWGLSCSIDDGYQALMSEEVSSVLTLDQGHIIEDFHALSAEELAFSSRTLLLRQTA